MVIVMLFKYVCSEKKCFLIIIYYYMFGFLSIDYTESSRADIQSYHASDKIVGILLDRSRSHDSVKITVLGVEIRIGRLIEFETGGEQSKMADNELVAMDLF